MNDEWLKIVGIVVVLGFIIYLAAKSLKIHRNMVEGLTMPADTSALTTGVTNGQAGTANAYAAAIKAQVIKMQDVLLITKYRTDYENLLMTVEEYSNAMMLSKVISVSDKINKNGVGKNITQEILNDMDTTNKLKSFIDTLNATMKYIDRR